MATATTGELQADATNEIHLSTELLVIVFSHLQFRDLGNCCLVSIRLKEIIKNTPELQYYLETQAAAYSRHPLLQDRTKSIVDKFEDFRKVQRNWRDPRPEKVLHWISPTPSAFCDAFGGVVIGSSFDVTDLFIVHSDPGPRFEQLSMNRRVLPRGVDVSQDLLAVVAMDETLGFRQLEFLSLKTGRRHHRAQRRAIDETHLGYAAVENCVMDVFARMSISGDWLIFEVGHTCDELNIYLCHWPTGEIRARWTSDREVWYQHAYLTTSHLFISHVVLPRQPHIDVYALSAFPAPTRTDTPVARFALPELDADAKADSVRYFTFSARPDHSLCESPHAPETALLCLTVRHSGGAMLFVPLSTFTSVQPSVDVPEVHPWVSWGPQRTRVCEGADLLALSGMRAVLSDRIFDFNPWDAATNAYMPVRLDSNAESECNTSREARGRVLHCGPSIASKDAGLCGEVVTGLAYREVLVKFDEEVDLQDGWVHIQHDEDGPKLVHSGLRDNALVLVFYKL
ncbi:uncharacterized protein PHACADRAFT_195181 [Phanerochaete carnosa HHB-10118-sp]|uniref:F-box domain-containing protein n=1 Tax=Phanerochaete carnosa (strain HHB-10118-sp) TaxID=650164 RepID=K5W847_PHACS|nr:uncharacterized protein PHACADRAFT_195181 [Phanerochaete carnosa HHB-10118-sp]EKM55154.1 hypothetical protein PHACADRAFT_195181 [Phanerochaete carnosa HHB-10118-sp]